MYPWIKQALNNRIAFEVKRQLASYKNANDIQNTCAIPASALVTGSTIHGTVRIGEGTRIGYSLIAGHDISIGRHCSINGPNTTMYAEVNAIRIGHFTAIARNVDIQEWNHPTEQLSIMPIRNMFFGGRLQDEMVSKGDILIGSDVWIGTQAVVVSGAQISDGAVVAANAVVTGHVPPFAIVAGNPARVIKYRFSPEVIDLLLKIKWWNWSDDQISNRRDFFERDWRVQDDAFLTWLHDAANT